MPVNAPIAEQLSYGWGRAAVSRFAKTPEQIQAEIIKALEGKISVEFKDYSQWQRVPLPQPPPPQPKSLPKPFKKVPSTRPLTGASGTSCSSLCLHPWNKKPPPIDHTAEIEAKERIAILKLQIEAKQKSLNQYKELCSMLKQQNKSLKDEIDEISSHAHKTVTELLEKYESYSGASKTMKRTHAKEEILAQQNLKVTSEQLNAELEHLENEVANRDSLLNDFQQDLQILRTYKDKEYPVKAMQISKLGKKVEELELEQRLEQNEIERITAGETSKLHAYRENKMREMMESAADQAFNANVPAGLQHMAWHNSLLQHEIEEHREGVRNLEDEIQVLRTEIKELKQSPRTKFRSYVFPEAFLPKRICDPDEDVILDIPTQQPLPI